MKKSALQSQSPYKPSRRFLFAIALAAGLLNIGELLSLWQMSHSLIWLQIFHAGWLLSVWTYSLLLHLFVRKSDESISQSTSFIIIGTGVAAVLLPVCFPFLDYITEIQLSTNAIIYGTSSQLFFAFMIMVALNGVYHAEKLYRSFNHERTFRLTLFTLIGTLCFWMLLSSLALMYRYLNINALMVGFAPSLAANILLAYYIVKGDNGPQLEIRRSALYRSATLLVSGIFLLLLGFMGQIIRIIGTHLDFFIAFLAAFLILLISLTILLFGSIKQRVRRFIDLNFYKSSYDYRTEWEQANRRILPIHDAQSLQQEILYAVAESVGADRSCLLMQDATNQLFVAVSNRLQIQPEQISRDVLDWVWRYGKPIEVKQTSLDEEALIPLVKNDVQIVMPVIFEQQLMALILLAGAGRKYTQ